MRVIHLSKMTGAAGSEGHLLALLPGLRARGVDARLWVLVEPDVPLDEYLARAGALGIPAERLIIRRDLDPALLWNLARPLRREMPDILHTHLIHADLYGVLAARLANVPHVVSSRHNDDRFRTRLPVRLLNRVLWRGIDAGIAISAAIRTFSLCVEGAPAERLHTIPYGLDPATVPARPDARAALRAALGLPAEALLVGSVCRLVEQKGLIYGLRGFAAAAGEIPEAHYVIAGDGPLRPALEAEGRALGVSEHVHFLGWHDDAHAVFAALDVFLAPSLWEGFGLVFLEAMAHCLPVISTTVSAIPEIIVDGETGWLVPPRDADALAGALRTALTDPAARRARGANGRARLEAEFTVEAMVERTLTVYRNLEARR